MTSRYFVEPDEHGVPELWHETGSGDPRLVAWQYGHLKRGMSVHQDYADLLWRVVTGVLAPDDATVERVADALIGNRPQLVALRLVPEGTRDIYRSDARAVLAALADPDGGAA